MPAEFNKLYVCWSSLKSRLTRIFCLHATSLLKTLRIHSPGLAFSETKFIGSPKANAGESARLFHGISPNPSFKSSLRSTKKKHDGCLRSGGENPAYYFLLAFFDLKRTLKNTRIRHGPQPTNSAEFKF